MSFYGVEKDPIFKALNLSPNSLFCLLSLRALQPPLHNFHLQPVASLSSPSINPLLCMPFLFCFLSLLLKIPPCSPPTSSSLYHFHVGKLNHKLTKRERQNRYDLKYNSFICKNRIHKS